jgi:hypothetical protein
MRHATSRSLTESGQKDRASLQIIAWQIRVLRQSIKRSLEMVQNPTQKKQNIKKWLDKAMVTDLRKTKITIINTEELETQDSP